LLHDPSTRNDSSVGLVRPAFRISPYPEPVAQVDILFEGYLGRPDDRVASTVSLVRDGDAIVIVDPGLVPGPHSILDPLAGHGIRPEDVTDAVFSHHHPDHTLNAALFPTARFHDHWAIYQGDLWTSRDAEGFQISPAVSLLHVRGHSNEDIATVVQTEDGLVVFTHAWWTAEVPVEDPYAPDPRALHACRDRILELSPTLIVPGHGAPFQPGPATPR
jgi:glyoxylase-like metal-dependent hydrolase (beta-lactamase superfamily II)